MGRDGRGIGDGVRCFLLSSFAKSFRMQMFRNLPAFSLCFCVKICTLILSFNRLSCTVSGNFESIFEKPLRCAKCFKVAGEGEKKKKGKRKKQKTHDDCANAMRVLASLLGCSPHVPGIMYFYVFFTIIMMGRYLARI